MLTLFNLIFQSMALFACLYRTVFQKNFLKVMDGYLTEPVLSEAVARRCSVKKVFLKIPQNSQENTCARVSYLIKLQASSCNFIKKETLAQVFSCQFCEISRNTFCY